MAQHVVQHEVDAVTGMSLIRITNLFGCHKGTTVTYAIADGLLEIVDSENMVPNMIPKEWHHIFDVTVLWTPTEVTQARKIMEKCKVYANSVVLESVLEKIMEAEPSTCEFWNHSSMVNIDQGTEQKLEGIKGLLVIR